MATIVGMPTLAGPLPWRSELCKLTEIARALALSRHAPGAAPRECGTLGKGMTPLLRAEQRHVG